MAAHRFPPCLSPKPMIVALAAAYLAMPALAANDTRNKEDEAALPTIVVEGDRIPKDEIGHSRVYTRDISNVYKGKQEIETYRGNSVSDLISGMVGVYSGDSRNSGAIDPNIRGVQGQGRIPVTVDGTEQSITVWRGYAGVNNRNYVDPNIISSVYVEKGPSLNREIRSGIGGAMAMKTIDADDIVPEGQKYGLEVRVETGNNSIEPLKNIYGNSVDYRTLGNPYDVTGGMWRVYFSGGDRQAQRFDGQNKFFGDRAFRIAAATKQENFDAMLAYAYRNKGNYFSGKNGGENYGQGNDPNADLSALMTQNRSAYMPWIALLYNPGGEVTNTSLNTRSWLGKFTLKPAEGHALKLGLRHTDTRFGEVMPSRLGVTPDTFGTVLQWPEARVKQQAVNLDWRWKPQDNRWIDLNASLWTTHTRSKTNSAGGAPGDVLYLDNKFDNLYFAYDQFSRASLDELRKMGINPAAMGIDTNQPDWRTQLMALLGIQKPDINNPDHALPNTDNRFNTIAGEAYYTRNNRVGFNLSNKLKLHDNLELTLIGDIQHETLKGHSNFDEFFRQPNRQFDDYQAGSGYPHRIQYNTQHYNVATPRAGQRREWSAGFNFKFRPTHWLTLNAGARYSTFRAQDDYVLQHFHEYIKPRNAEGKMSVRIGTAHRIRASVMTQDEYNVIRRIEDEGRQYDPDSWTQAEKDLIRERQWDADSGIWQNEHFIWLKDRYGRYNLADNPWLNGSINTREQVVNPATGALQNKYDITWHDGGGGATYGGKSTHISLDEKEINALRTKRGHGWAPVFSATAQLSPYARLYARYTEHLRFPSIFEATMGFSTGTGRLPFEWLPEHAKNWEVGYVHDLTGLLPKLRHADVRLNYFQHTTKNVMDRNDQYEIYQYDKQVRRGLELQARFDSGRVFGDLGVTRNLKNQVCDKAMTTYLNWGGHSLVYNMPECVNGGIDPNGYLPGMVAPRWSVVANLGARFFNEKLEVGNRFTYHSRAYDTWLKTMQDTAPPTDAANRAFSGPYRQWQPLFLWDAYVRYRINKHFSAELSGTNLTDRYYLDPLTRSFMPGPGRSIRLGISGKW